MKHILPAICCLALVSIPVLAQKPAPMSDQKFLDVAAQTDMVEANLGQLAQESAAKQPVKDYAQMLVNDHTQDFGKLQTLAAQTGLTIPNAIDAEHNKVNDRPLPCSQGGGLRSQVHPRYDRRTHRGDRALQEGSARRGEFSGPRIRRGDNPNSPETSGWR